MSLRFRLTLLYMSLVGATLLLFSVLVYEVVYITLLDQIDSQLTNTSEDLTRLLKVNAANQIDLREIINYSPTQSIIFVLWNNNERMVLARPTSLQISFPSSVNKKGEAIFYTQFITKNHLRVLAVPLKTRRGPAGTLQVAVNLSLVDNTISNVSIVLVVLAVIALLLSGIGAWLVIGQTLAPLAVVTRTATSITRADDLHLRIPLAGPPNDEVGQLIQAFNQTLERLEKLFTTQKRFLTDVSHELRTPLTVIKGNAGLMRQMNQVDDESLASIEEEVDRLTRLVGDLLLLAQAESGKLPMIIGPVALDTVLLEVYEQMRLLAGEKLKLRLVEIDQVPVSGDRDRLKQVLINLVGNAIHYTPPGGEVTLALRKVNDQAQVLITDTGPGIAPEDMPHIFERFYRGDKTRKRSPGSGFGLGLSIAYWIVRSHNGSIEVNSVEGSGTTFAVRLPLRNE